MITLRMGSRGFRVKQLQKLLRVAVDGVYGKNTKDAVIVYQKKYQLVVDGVVGTSTWKSLLKKRTVEKYKDTFVKTPQSNDFWDVEPMLGTLFLNTPRNRKMLKEGFAALEPYSEILKIDTRYRFLNFVAQMREEVGSNITVTENLNYSCRTLPGTFLAYRKRPKLATQDGRCDGHPAKPYSIARRAYGNRMGNKPYPDHEGYLYRGRGAHMVTGKNNYTQLDNYIRSNLPKIYNNFKPLRQPDALSGDANWLLSGAVFWAMDKLYRPADSYGVTKVASNLITDKINRYTNSHGSRYKHLKTLKRVYS